MSSFFRPTARALRLGALAALGFAAACESSNGSSGFTPQEGTVQINASDRNNFTYFTFTGDSGLVVPNPSTSTAWDMAFRRFEVRLNGGVAGPKGVAGYNLANNATKTDAELLALTEANTLGEFQGIGLNSIPAANAFTVESLAEDESGWFVQSPAGLSANRNAKWKVRLNGGGYALFRLDSLIVDQATATDTTSLRGLVVRYRLQPAGGALSATETVDTILIGSDTAAAYSIGTQAQVAPTTSGCGWDLRVNRNYRLKINANAGCTAGTFPVDASITFAAVADASDAPQYGPFFSLVSGPIPNSFTDRRAPFLYQLDPAANPPRLSPSFNIYLIKVGDAVYKVQFTNYYSQSGQSGYPTMRYTRIR